MSWSILKAGSRWLVGLWLIWLCVKGLTNAMQSDMLEAAGKALVAFASGIAGVLLIAPVFAPLAARPFVAFIESIYLPGGHASRPPLDYKLADHYRKTRKIDEAIAEYARIVRYYPDEVVAHARLYQLLAEEKGDTKAARRAHHRAERALRHRAEALREYEALTS